MKTAQRIARINKSIELQNRIRANVEKTCLENVSVDIFDNDRLLSKIDEIIEMLEARKSQIERRSLAVA